MEAVFGLLLMLLGVSHGVETNCDVQQEDGAQCYGALGGTLILRMKHRSPARFQITQNNKNIFRWINDKVLSNATENKYLFTPSDGTFRINNLIRSDSAKYRFKISDSNGKTLLNRTRWLSIQGNELFILQRLPCSVLETVKDCHDSVNMSNIIFVPLAPVLAVQLVSKCLSQGEMRVSCSSEGGESLQYSWTLNGRMLTKDKLLSGTQETDSITLRQDVSGVLACSVKNHVSDIQTVQMINTCGFIFIDCIGTNETRISQWVFEANNTLCVSTKAPDTTVAMAGVLAALAVLLLVGGAVIYALKKKKNNQPEEEGDEKELTYSEVRIVPRGRVPQRVDPDVEMEYGQIKFSKQPRRTVEPTDDCVYAKVR